MRWMTGNQTASHFCAYTRLPTVLVLDLIIVDVKLGGTKSCVVTLFRYCIDNGAMIAQAGIFSFQMNLVTPMSDASCTQR